MDFKNPENLGKARKKDDIIVEARERHRLAREYYRDQREKAVEELSFSLGNEQWNDSNMPEEWQLVFNRIIGTIDQVVGDQRQNRPEIKIRPENEAADPGVADKLQDWIRQIRYDSSADIAIDHAFEHAIAGRFGFWKITTEYEEDDSFNQVPRIRRINNNCSASFDPAAQEWDRSDAMWCFVDERFTKEEFKRRWPKAEMAELEGDDLSTDNWIEGEDVRVTEYWRKVKQERTLYAMPDGSTVFDDDERLDYEAPVNERKVITHKVQRYLLNGAEVLEGPDEWAGKYIPVVPLWGKEFNINGVTNYRSVTTYAMDPQREYNYSHVQATRTLRLVPTAPFIGTADQLADVMPTWQDALVNDYMALYYNHDPQAPGAPERSIGPTIPPGLMQMMQISADEIKTATGYFDASLGQKSNETSGKAIQSRQRESDVSTFAYMDNLCRSLVYTGKVLVDLAPKLIDTNRSVMTMKSDGKSQMVEFNKPQFNGKTGQVEILNDLRKGKYGVTVTTGPSYGTQRQEVVANMVEIGRAAPNMAPLCVAIMAENMDFHGAERFAKAAKMMLPESIQQTLAESPGDEQEQAGPIQQIGQQVQMLQQNVQKMAQILEQVLKKQQTEDQADELDVAIRQAKLGGMRLDNERKIHGAAKDMMNNLTDIYQKEPVGAPMVAEPPPKERGGEGGFY